jgi:signal transduction histidine kinase
MQPLFTIAVLNKTVKRSVSFLFLLFNLSLYSQVNDTTLIETIFTTGRYYINSNSDSANWFFEKGKEESESRKYSPGLIMYYNYNAALQIALNHNEKAFEYYDEAVAIAQSKKLDTDLGLTYMKKGTLSQFMGDYAQAAECFLAAASVLKTNEDRKKIIGLYKNMLPTLNNLQQQNKSLQNVLPALKNDNTDEKEITAILSQKKTNEANLYFSDQTTIQEVTGGNIYVIFGGAKFRITGFNELANYSNYRSINKIPDGMLSRIPGIPFDGTILRQSNDAVKVYLVKDKMRHLIENPKVLEFFGGWDVISTVPENTLVQVPDAGDTVTLQNVMTTFNFRKEYDVLIDTLETTLLQNNLLLAEVGEKLKAKNNVLQKRKILLWTSLLSIAALLCIGFLLVRNSRQKQKLHQQSLQALAAEQELQRSRELEKERTRIATDMHDDLGAGLSTIRFLSEKVKRNSFSDVTKNDTLEDLLFYTRSYAVEYCEENNLICETRLPQKVTAAVVSGEIRRNVFLTVKESMHNIVKHANARKVLIDFNINSSLLVTIQDDGKGFSEKGKDNGNGLRNMQKRMESVNGTFEITNINGVIVKIKVPL